MIFSPLLDRRRLIFNTNAVIIFLVIILTLLKQVITGFESPPIPAFIVVAGAVWNLVYLRRGGSLDIAAWLLISLLLFGLAFGGFNNYGFWGPVVLLAPLISIFALLLINSRAAVVVLVLVTLILSGLVFVDIVGILPPNTNTSATMLLGRFIALMALCLVSTWVVWLFATTSKQLLEKIEKQSITDYLTEIMNRRGIEIILSREIARARRTDTWLSVIMIDVDFFKRFNDNHGHQAGDRCLIQVADIIQSCMARQTDLLGRFGGEEFMVILPDTNIEGAAKVAESIRLCILKNNILYGASNANPLSVTLGVAGARGTAVTSVDQLIRLADDALYRGKHQGRNCVVTEGVDDDS